MNSAMLVTSKVSSKDAQQRALYKAIISAPFRMESKQKISNKTSYFYSFFSLTINFIVFEIY